MLFCLCSWKPNKIYNLERYTLLKSAFVHKKHRVQYEVRTYFHFVHFHRLTGSTLSTFLEYIERNLPEGMAMKATKVELLALPEHLQKPPEPVHNEQVNWVQQQLHIASVQQTNSPINLIYTYVFRPEPRLNNCFLFVCIGQFIGVFAFLIIHGVSKR